MLKHSDVFLLIMAFLDETWVKRVEITLEGVKFSIIAFKASSMNNEIK